MTEENKQDYRVRSGLVVALSDTQIYESGSSLSLTDSEYARHAHQLETEEQFQAREKASKTTKKTTTKTEDK